MKVSYTEVVRETEYKEIERIREVAGCYECPYLRRTRDKDLYYDPFYDTYMYYCGKKKGFSLGMLSFGAAANEAAKQREAFGNIPKGCPFNK